MPGEAVQRFIDREQPLGTRGFRRYLQLVKAERAHTPTVADAPPPPRTLNQDSPHCLRCRAEEMRAVLPGRLLISAEAQPRLVH